MTYVCRCFIIMPHIIWYDVKTEDCKGNVLTACRSPKSHSNNAFRQPTTLTLGACVNKAHPQVVNEAHPQVRVMGARTCGMTIIGT